ncbi:MAG: hypothetical protein LLG06_07195 [Desulfobacteraceae bacterium]|nr:hypothetical protein [Desulfobacteraceae bacterium]
MKIKAIASLIASIMPDIVAILGLSLLGYGLWLHAPWISFTTVGAILLTAGIRLGRGADDR